MIPADVRFLTTKDTFIAQAALTGESNPVEKFSVSENGPEDGLTDLRNLGFTGSNVISGSATAIVLTTGNDTYLGVHGKIFIRRQSKIQFLNEVWIPSAAS